jgi:hypothetical protein
MKARAELQVLLQAQRTFQLVTGTNHTSFSETANETEFIKDGPVCVNAWFTSKCFIVPLVRCTGPDIELPGFVKSRELFHHLRLVGQLQTTIM